MSTENRHNNRKGDRARDRTARSQQPRREPLKGNRIRVRGKRLDEIDDAKLTLAYWLLAQQLVEDRTDGPKDVDPAHPESDGDREADS